MLALVLPAAHSQTGAGVIQHRGLTFLVSGLVIASTQLIAYLVSPQPHRRRPLHRGLLYQSGKEGLGDRERLSFRPSLSWRVGAGSLHEFDGIHLSERLFCSVHSGTARRCRAVSQPGPLYTSATCLQGNGFLSTEADLASSSVVVALIYMIPVGGLALV
jgi:hypothetical protein